MPKEASPGSTDDVSGYSTFRHVAWAGQFEGQTTIGLGVRGCRSGCSARRAGHRVRATSPSRASRWRALASP
ncbi:AMIN-like domain-containing (lipo)protein [Lentzea roselyniae]|uniref:AMIN-like domain-containing (lipo)protein n=1 Tax=Lentzea roselyniae TaxID=531940 RepID=UPI003D15929E